MEWRGNICMSKHIKHYKYNRNQQEGKIIFEKKFAQTAYGHFCK